MDPIAISNLAQRAWNRAPRPSSHIGQFKLVAPPIHGSSCVVATTNEFLWSNRGKKPREPFQFFARSRDRRRDRVELKRKLRSQIAMLCYSAGTRMGMAMAPTMRRVRARSHSHHSFPRARSGSTQSRSGERRAVGGLGSAVRSARRSVASQMYDDGA